ncbi:hypothetical protein N0V85_004098 [Neurospora sp. IMI 360204]|nr:hypothetical protein N0V85_004098 [Neurospora sp. IMI 360204]
MPRLYKAHGSAPYIYITSPDSSNSSISASASDFNPGSNSLTSSDSSYLSPGFTFGSSSLSSSAAEAWRSNASELRDVTRDFSAARATSTDAKTKSYTEKEVARFEAMARNAELMASMAMATSAAKRRDGVSKCA